MSYKLNHILISVISSALLAGCTITSPDSRTDAQINRDKNGSILGTDTKTASPAQQQVLDSQLKINAYLWRASLEILSNNPLDKIDVKSGFISTQWVSMKGKPDLQIKVSALVLSDKFKSTGVDVKVYQRKKTVNGWINEDVDYETVQTVKRAILQRATTLNIAKSQ